MRGACFLSVLLVLASPGSAQRQSLGVFGEWGAFREKNGARCFAIAEPARPERRGEAQAFASIGYWPTRGVRGQVHFRLSGRKRSGSAILLRVDERTFQLVGGGINAWAPDPRADADIIGALRTGVAMSVETRSERGTIVRDQYRLRGAATAIDAAAIACARRGGPAT